MASGKRRQTFEKLNRERKVREKRALKAARREQRKLGANVLAEDGTVVDGDAAENASTEPVDAESTD